MIINDLTFLVKDLTILTCKLTFDYVTLLYNLKPTEMKNFIAEFKKAKNTGRLLVYCTYAKMYTTVPDSTYMLPSEIIIK